MSNAFKRSLNKLTNAVGIPHQISSGVDLLCDFLSADALKLLHALPDSASLHHLNGDAVWVSKKSEKLLQATVADLQGAGFFSEANPQDRIKILKAFSDCALYETEQNVVFRKQQMDATGTVEVRQFELRISPYENKGGVLFLALVRDVSSQEQKMSSAQKELEEAQALNSTKNLFLSNMSHELRTPLNAIIGFSQMMMGEGGVVLSDDKKTEYAGLINQSSTHLLNIINDVLDLSKIGAGKFQITKELVSLSDELKSTLQLMTPIAEKADVILKCEIEDSIPDITADQRALRQVMINLIANAIKFSKPGSVVTVKASRKLRKVKLEICDSGLGMAQDTVDKLGNSFFQADQTTAKHYEGTGLGLSIVFGLVQLHEGKVAFSSELGKGTTVCVELPISQQSSMPVPSNPNEEIIFLNQSKEPNLLRRLDTHTNRRKTG